MCTQTSNETERLLRFIQKSPTAFHAVTTAANVLLEQGFSELRESEDWNLQPGKGYYVTRNGSSIIAFRLPTQRSEHFLIAASHTDSPMLKVKREALSEACGEYLRLNTEIYGGTILSTWLDRPLTLAGRVIRRDGDLFSSENVYFDRDLCLIPNVAIHLNRTVNNGYAYHPAIDMLPLFAQEKGGNNALLALLSEELHREPESIVGADLYVVNRTAGTVWGKNGEFFSSPRIDNLMCAYGTLRGFCDVIPEHAVSVYYASDNEETGSATKQGAGSVFLSDTLDRICEALGTDKRCMLASSMMISADNGHAKHPNHPELSDAQNAPKLNGGVVIKYNAAQKYTTEGMSAALFEQICHHADVPIQCYANRSDLPGGSTLGSISNTLVPLLTVDIGMAQLAMHSAYETAGSRDTEYLVRAMQSFYSCRLLADGDGRYRISFDDAFAN